MTDILLPLPKQTRFFFKGAETYTDQAELNDFLKNQLRALDDKEYDKAIKLFYLAMLEEDPKNSISLLEEACELEPEYTFMIAYIGNIQRGYGMKEEAFKTYEKALELNKTDYMAIRGIGILELLSGNKEKGLELARQAFEIEPFGVYVPETLVIALWENGKLEEAQELIEHHKQNEYVFEQELDSYLKGNLTMEEYFTHQGGE